MSTLFSSLTDGDLKRIAAVLLLIFFNFIFAVVGALMRNDFDTQKVPEFIYKQILPFLVGLAFFEAFLHLLPPSTLMADLFHGSATATLSGAGTAVAADPTEGWKWLDPTVLWATYGAIVIDLATRTFANLAFMFGKSVTLAQGIAKTEPTPAAKKV